MSEHWPNDKYPISKYTEIPFSPGEPHVAAASLFEQCEMYRTMLIELHKSKMKQHNETIEHYEKRLLEVALKHRQLEMVLEYMQSMGFPKSAPQCFTFGFKRIWRALWRKNQKPDSVTVESFPSSRPSKTPTSGPFNR